MGTDSLSTPTKLLGEKGIKVEFKNWWQKLKLKKALSHIGLLITLMIYTIVGGLVS